MSHDPGPQLTDVVVLGGGATGENVAARAVLGGLDAVLMEADLVGGECSFWACMPSKALLRPGAALAAARRLPGAAEAVSGGPDVGAVLKRRDVFAENWDDADQVAWAEGAGVTVIRGRGRLVGERTVAVDADGETTTWTARHAVVLATGSEPVVPPIDGLDRVRFWDSRAATSTQHVPHRLGVIGGGPVGVELAQAFARLGSRVTVLAQSRLLGRMDPQAADLVTEALREDGVEVRLMTSCTSVSRDGADGEVALTLEVGDVVRVDELLVATGRRPRTEGIGLEDVGLDPGARLDVDPSGRVRGVPGGWLYAAGDVTGQAPLTHMGKYAGRVVGDAVAARAAGREQPGEWTRDWSRYAATALRRSVPMVVFTDPQIASVGLTLDEAAGAGIAARAVDLEIAVPGARLHADGYQGWARLVVDEDRRVVIGATFAGQDVAELLHSATIAVVGEVPLDRLWHAVPPYPTISEVWLRLLEAYGL